MVTVVMKNVERKPEKKVTLDGLRETVAKMAKDEAIPNDQRLSLQEFRVAVAKAKGKPPAAHVGYACAGCHKTCDGSVMEDNKACHPQHLPHAH